MDALQGQERQSFCGRVFEELWAEDCEHGIDAESHKDL